MMKARHQQSDDEEQQALIIETTKGEGKTENADTHLKSVVKGISWRIIASLTTISIAYIVTGQVATALEIGAIEFFFKVFIYYIHERIWVQIRL
mmetsp:Transcript_35018/g.49718  ORF Transcript_35018/g.49718 Transcript_35018/m.49718 type:complete len:94 (+) Transcript_35018:830-1111(+)